MKFLITTVVVAILVVFLKTTTAHEGHHEDVDKDRGPRKCPRGYELDKDDRHPERRRCRPITSRRTTRDPCHSSTTTTEAHAMTCPTVKTCPKGYIYYDDPTDDKCPTCILDCKVTHCPPCDDLVYVPNGCPYCKRRPKCAPTTTTVCPTPFCPPFDFTCPPCMKLVIPKCFCPYCDFATDICTTPTTISPEPTIDGITPL